MTLKDTIKRMHIMLEHLAKDLKKASEKGIKAASQRVRTDSIKFAKLSKLYRKESIASERGGRKRKKVTKRKTTRKKATTRVKKTTKRRKTR